MTHLGRPDGKFIESLKVDVIGKELELLLNTKVIKLDDCVGDDVVNQLKEMNSDIYILENTRFHAEEEKMMRV